MLENQKDFLHKKQGFIEMKRNQLLMLAILLVLTLFSVNLSSATISNGNPVFNLTQFSYSPNQTIEGYLNFSLTNEPGDKILEAAITKSGIELYKKQMTLLDFLRNSSISFNCSQNCLMRYSSSPNGQNPKTISLHNNGEANIGLVAQGPDVSIINLTFI